MGGVLRDSECFPNFAKLPDETINDGGVPYLFQKPWCILGEIVDNSQAGSLRHNVIVKDKVGHRFAVYFYHESEPICDVVAVKNLDSYAKKYEREVLQKDKPPIDAWCCLKVGSTICVRLAKQHAFRDGQFGIRVENLEFVKVIRANINDLLLLSDKLHESVSEETGGTLCWMCKQPAQPNCAKCKVAKYCSKTCQTENWPRHKIVCSILPDYFDLVDTDLKKIIGFNIAGQKFKRPFTG